MQFDQYGNIIQSGGLANNPFKASLPGRFANSPITQTPQVNAFQEGIANSPHLNTLSNQATASRLAEGNASDMDFSKNAPTEGKGLGLSGLEGAQLGLTGLGMALNYSGNKQLREKQIENLGAQTDLYKDKSGLARQDLIRRNENYRRLTGGQ